MNEAQTDISPVVAGASARQFLIITSMISENFHEQDPQQSLE
jgi:hypothetical protein